MDGQIKNTIRRIKNRKKNRNRKKTTQQSK